jgi:hypothetical protein
MFGNSRNFSTKCPECDYSWVEDLSSAQLIEAVRLWAGWGQSAFPSRDENRLTNRFGRDVAIRFTSTIKLLEDDFYSSAARFTAANRREMGDIASEHFLRIHPTAAKEIVQVFAWCYTFDFK